MDVKDIKIRDYIYQLTVPEAARYRDSKEELKRFLDLFAQKFDAIKEKIDNFPSLVDIDTCPPEFLPYLGALVGYEYDPLLPAESQRETIKRIISIYQRKGTPQSIIDIVAPYDPNAHIFEPGYNVARHGVSKFSGSDRFQDKWYWRTGVFELVTSADNLHELRDLIKSYRPAGKKLWFTNLYQIPLNDAFLFGIHDGGTTIIVQPPSINGLAGAAFSAHTKARQRSGRQMLWGFFLGYGVELDMTSFLRGTAPSIPFSDEHIMPQLFEYDQIPLGTPMVLSKYVGKRSGGAYHQYEIREIPMTDWLRGNYQPPVVVVAQNIRPAYRSNHARRSGSFTMSGVYNGGWDEYKPIFLFQNAGYVVLEKPVEVGDNGVTLVFEPTFVTWKGRSETSRNAIRSGKQILWNESTIYQEAMSDARRYEFDSPLYSFDDIERVQPDFKVEDVLYALNTYESFFEFQMRAVFDPAIVVGESNILVFDSYVNASGMKFSGSAHVVHQEGQADMRRYIIGSPLYTYADLIEIDPKATVGKPIDIQPKVEATYGFEFSSSIKFPMDVPYDERVLIQEDTSDAVGMKSRGDAYILGQEDKSDSKRYIIGSMLYSFADLLRINPQMKVGDVNFFAGGSDLLKGFELASPAPFRIDVPYDDRVLVSETQADASGMENLKESYTLSFEDKADAKQYAFGSVLYSFNDLIEIDPDMTVDGVAYALGAMDNMTGIEMTDGTVFEEGEKHTDRTLWQEDYTDASGMEVILPDTTVSQESYADMRHYPIGSILYSFDDLIAIDPEATVDSVRHLLMPSDIELGLEASSDLLFQMEARHDERVLMYEMITDARGMETLNTNRVVEQEAHASFARHIIGSPLYTFDTFGEATVENIIEYQQNVQVMTYNRATGIQLIM